MGAGGRIINSADKMNILMQMVGITPMGRVSEPANDYTRAGWRKHVEFYAKTGNVTHQLRNIHSTAHTKVADFINGKPFLHSGYAYTVENNKPLGFCSSEDKYHVIPAAPQWDTTQFGWRLHIEYYEKYGIATKQVQAAILGQGFIKAKEFANAPDGSLVGCSAHDIQYDSMNFNIPTMAYTIHPKIIKRQEVMFKRIYTNRDDGWLKCEPQPVADATRNDATYLGTLIVRDYFENDLLIEQATVFEPKF